ncbi:Polygalacturonase inhibitor [Heracleum sosnowskyi]|uniref:Polygalacturonase inhibitor n=1 Tax=Heracleum sosnowskyi TaxID=360622 RepID=A0AAD8NA63_9APIA|nr:Polygalacturonase inhibitor [Heracleum sosnowskyi]
MLPLLFFILVFPGVISSEPCHPDDIYSILAFKNSFSNGDILQTWSSDMDCCHRFDCENNRVTVFSIFKLELSGSIKPDAFAGFTYLKRLMLHKLPFLVGEIPRSIENLTHLTSLVITWTSVTGPVPNNLSKLKNLQSIDFSFNKLHGSLPPSLPLLPSISEISLSRNQLTGSVPETYGHFPITLNLPILMLSHNKLSGKLPVSLGSVNFSEIDLSRNSFSGDASMLFGEEKGCQLLDISRNNFEFDFSTVGLMNGGLITLDISHNKIYGKIPLKITDAFFLQQLNMSYNRLCGEIPKRWKLKYRQGGFDNSSFFHNRCLCGAPLDPCKP